MCEASVAKSSTPGNWPHRQSAPALSADFSPRSRLVSRARNNIAIRDDKDAIRVRFVEALPVVWWRMWNDTRANCSRVLGSP